MTEFKVGDRVRIIDLDESGNTMRSDYLNETGVITKIDVFVYLKMDNEALPDTWIEEPGFQIELVL